MSKFPSFLRLNNIPLYLYTTFCLPVNPLMNIWVISTLLQLWITLLWTLLYKYLFKSLMSKHPEVELLDPPIIFWGTTVLLFTLSTLLFILPLAMSQGSSFCLFFPTLIIFWIFNFYFFIVAILMGKKWYLIVVLICISLMIIPDIFYCVYWL